MKTCSRCKQEKTAEEFNKKGSKLQPYCKPCDREKSKEYYRANAEKMRSQIYASRKERHGDIKEYIRDIKGNTPCMDCGIQYPYYVMDFDHQGNKEFNISHATKLGKTFDKIKQEINKCEIVCANCHRIRTYA